LGKLETGHLKGGLSSQGGSFKVPRKFALVFLGLVISFLLTPQVGSPEALVDASSSLIISARGVNIHYEEKAYESWIEVEYKDSCLKIRAFCFNNTSEEEVLRYKLEVTKSGKSGTTNSSQAGSVHIPSQEKRCLSQATLGISPKDHYQIKLGVYKDGKLVTGDLVFYPRTLQPTNDCVFLFTSENYMNL
jgi:hypothetical protein